MLSGIGEWVYDLYEPDYYSKSPKEDPKSFSGSKRVGRGIGKSCKHRISCRIGFDERTYLNFRVVRLLN